MPGQIRHDGRSERPFEPGNRARRRYGFMKNSSFVIPANAGIQGHQRHGCRPAPA
jgi:hypothetical protein